MITLEEMHRLEKRSAEMGVSAGQLMDSAGRAVAKEIRKRIPPGKKILILAMHGNNGGDGFVAARHLLDQYRVHIWFLGDESKLSAIASKNYDLLPRRMFVSDGNLEGYDVLVDALLGTGARGRLREPLHSLSAQWNMSSAFKVAIDIPTGLDPGTGEHTDLFEPDLIITFHDIKTGLIQWANKTVIVGIGIPPEAAL